ncbi:MAG: lantibiotic dehydratase [Kofleriaceae bacterium]
MAGVPFEALDRLATPRSIELARCIALAETELDAIAIAALATLREADPARPAKQVERARRALGQRHALPKNTAALAPEVARYGDHLAAVIALREALATTLADELAAARRALADAAAGPLRRYSVFSASSSVGERLAGDDSGDRGWRARAVDRLHLNYLQRTAAKNDTISEFGPTAWGRVDPGARGIALAPEPGIARRHVFLEKWVTGELAAAMTEDPEARLEAIPRIDPRGRLAGDRFLRDDLGTVRVLAADELAVLAALDTRSPILQRLADDGVVIWRFEAPVLDADRARTLLADVRAWHDSPAKASWLPVVEAITGAPARFADADTDGRLAIVAETEAQLAALGRTGKTRGRALYAATNPIGEDCVRECHFTLGGDVAAQFVGDAAPWLDLFRDTAAHAWRHVSRRLTELLASSPTTSLPGFLGHAERAGVPLAADGVARLANEAFREVQAVFERHFEARADAGELELTAEDYQLVRRHFAPPPASLWPCVDLQIAAASTAAVAAGDYQIVVGEVNSFCPVAAHVFFWGCPDRAAFAGELRRLSGDARACHANLGTLDRGNHVTFHWPEIFGADWTGVVADRLPSGYRTVAPGDASVVLVDGSLRVHGPGGADLGALVPEWDMPFALGIHPFVFRAGRHVPRLRAGRTILQRRQWTIALAELASGPYTGVAPALLGAVDRLRGDRGLPRHVFVRPSDRVMSERVSASGRDKDVKPFYVDLESYLFCEALHHRLVKYGELEVSEMLPAPDQLLWQEADGRRTFEMRILCGPGDQRRA